MKQLITAPGAVPKRLRLCLAAHRKCTKWGAKQGAKEGAKQGAKQGAGWKYTVLVAEDACMAGQHAVFELDFSWAELRHITHGIYLPLALKESGTHVELSCVPESGIEQLAGGKAPYRPLPWPPNPPNCAVLFSGC